MTLTLKSHDALFQALSTTSHVTLVCPMGKRLSACDEHVTSFTCPELSVAFGCFQITSAVGFPASVDVERFLGHNMFSASLSAFKQYVF